jgi:hypothetical protein
VSVVVHAEVEFEEGGEPAGDEDEGGLVDELVVVLDAGVDEPGMHDVELAEEVFEAEVDVVDFGADVVGGLFAEEGVSVGIL